MTLATAMVLEKPRVLTRQVFDVPDVTDDDAVLLIEACGLCGTDHEQYTGTLPGASAFIPGHESVGIINTIGQEASRLWGVKPGDRVAVEVFQSCRKCQPCRSGEYRRCELHGIADMYGFIPTAKMPRLWGGYATHQYLSRDTILHRLPDGLDSVTATLFNPLGAGIRWAATVPQTKTGDVVAVLGPGIRGICCTVAARKAGASFVMITGYGDRDTERLKLAQDFGADLAVDVAINDPVKNLLNACGSLADIVVNVTAKAPDTFAQSINMVKPGGTIVMAGTSGSAETPGFWPDLIVFKEIRILGALGVDSPAYSQAIEILASKEFPFDSLPRQVSPLNDADLLIRTMAGEMGSAPPVHAVLSP